MSNLPANAPASLLHEIDAGTVPDMNTPEASASHPPGTAIDTDVLVIGGGPAGTTAATLLARRGWRVLLLEKSRHPRFHIGESLLPMNLPILERLGVLEQVRAIGVHKAGADFPVRDAAGTTNVFRFDRAINPRFGHAFQVERARFDKLLFDNALANGVDAREQVTVRTLHHDADGRPHAADAVAGDGTSLAVRMRYVVDASGRDTFLGAARKLKRRNALHQSAAMFSHFTGVQRRTGDDAGNITVERFEHGWMWLIPLPDDVMSIGAVCYPEYLKQRRGDNESFLMQTLRNVPSVWERMDAAVRCGPVHATGNYSYTCSAMTGPGWVMAGDAFAFIDPVFSSGVYLAMNSAEAAAAVVDGSLRAPATERALQRAMDTRLRRGLKHFSWFIYRFNTPVMQRLFASPRNDWQIEQAVISMLAGDVFDNVPVLRRLRAFRLIYAINAVQIAPRAMLGWLRRRRQVGVAFSGETLRTGES